MYGMKGRVISGPAIFQNLFADEITAAGGFTRSNLPRHILSLTQLSDKLFPTQDREFFLPRIISAHSGPWESPPWAYEVIRNLANAGAWDRAFPREAQGKAAVQKLNHYIDSRGGFTSSGAATRNLRRFSGGLLSIPASHKAWEMMVVTGSAIPACTMTDTLGVGPAKGPYKGCDIDLLVDSAAVARVLGIDLTKGIEPFAHWLRDQLIKLHGVEVSVVPSEKSAGKCRLELEGYRPLELFTTFGVGAVYNFHVAPVRGWFDGSEWYLLPSAVIAGLTGLSVDFRYARSETSAVDIIRKYRKRGFFTLLNEREHNVLREAIGSPELYKQEFLP
jgi:hypothetical protein